MKFTFDQEAQIAEVLSWLQQAGAIKWRKSTSEEATAGSDAVGTLELSLQEDWSLHERGCIIAMDDDHSNLETEGYTGIGVDVYGELAEPFEKMFRSIVVDPESFDNTFGPEPPQEEPVPDDEALDNCNIT
jgi:hypothetical protein